ncbi:phosphate acyltransferase PlsX [Halanaerobiaceae bacterium Z-7014]|uniref:Phosphate acyltransferase n=1 Tax=Halonatronomonas betaini TaxID=2778430 RepID=A0A931ARY5_9FIRM|nr:phosphate acyltransferase PlsX [Halonatronomonas betaini]MBF8436776.1 phosphate acyltransferase PlsX [Halonatronomonas betaini]
MIIAVDAMGGDNAPEAVVKGSLKAVNSFDDITLKLVGKEDLISNYLEDQSYNQERLQVINATEEITMEDSPAKAIRKKKDSSIVVASELVKKGDAEALIAAGSTGAAMSAGVLKVGRLKGIKRPAISTLFPTENKPTLILDAGANANAEPEYLQQFALMGQIYAKKILNRDKPKIGLMNVGEEKGKGSKLTNEAFELIDNDKRIDNFAGNIEGRDIFTGEYDVIVTDGFTGNVILKTTEGLAEFMFSLLKDALTSDLKSKLGAFLVKDNLKKMKNKVDYREYGGAPLLGLNEIVIIGHGSSDATAFFNAIRVARDTIKEQVVAEIASEIARDGEN